MDEDDARILTCFALGAVLGLSMLSGVVIAVALVLRLFGGV